MVSSFDGLAENYGKFRPGYPAEAYDEFVAKLAGRTSLHIADIGCGTGINTRLLYQVFGAFQLSLAGIDISEDMLAEARREVPNAQFINAPAEQLPFADASVDIATVAQSIQWFRRDVFYFEAARVLKPASPLVLLENNRDWRASAFLDAFEQLLEQFSIRDDGSHYSRGYRDFDYESELRQHFGAAKVTSHSWTRPMTKVNFVGMATSSTQVQRIVSRFGSDFLQAELDKLFDIHAPDGMVDVLYNTQVYSAYRQ